MKVTIKLPGVSLASDLALARSAAELAVRQMHGHAAAKNAPVGSNNPCEQNRCTYLGTIYDDSGNPWLVYDCQGTIELYPG